MPALDAGGALPAGAVGNLTRGLLAEEIGCHDGLGAVASFRPYRRDAGSALVDFIDLVVVLPQASIGRHRHGQNVEWYVILAGSGLMWFGGELRQVGPGDVLVNPPQGEHGLENRGEEPLQLLVFQLSHDAQAQEH